MKYKLTILFIVIVVAIGFSYLYYLQAIKAFNPLSKDSVDFVIKPGEDVRTISQRLENQNLIRSGLVFFLKARLTDYGKNIQAGDFLLSQSMNMEEIAEELLHGKADVKLTIPEGWRKEEIAIKITSQFSIPESEILKTAREGYLFPDTYQIPKEASGSLIIKMMEENFDKKTAKIYKDGLSKRNLSLDQAIIIASLVEREAKLPEDRPVIASVILNRLSQGMKLDIDATVQYVLGYQSAEKRWWKKDLSLEDLEVESPYNTYTIPGLPPGPIANPGIASIEAVLTAPETEFIYYIADKNGKSHFAKTFEDHSANISKYLNK